MTRPPSLRPGDVHVWRVPLDVGAEELLSLTAVLSRDEIALSAGFGEVRRREFATCRGTLRRLLAAYLDVEPSALVLDEGEHGKPKLARDMRWDRLHFNVAHAGDLGLVAVAHSREVGVDVEPITPRRGMWSIAEQLFTEGEVAHLRGLPARQQLPEFLTCWTSKEAYLKATGFGMSALGTVEVLPVPRLNGWTLHQLRVDAGYAAALVVEGDATKISVL